MSTHNRRMRRRMLFNLTASQIRNRTKTVTRRFGWKNLKPGDVIMAIIGNYIKWIELCLIRIISLRGERLDAITKEDVVREGFPDMTPNEFVTMMKTRDVLVFDDSTVNRIEFEYVD